ncbi:hypothetical protein [Morganella morganii]|uniref:Tetratricopeptide repeat protein n=2 Tax=Bacteria TaxID=2 RepID=A0AAU6TYH6_UNCXX|nr:hypothetical protein [Morganella morganii]MBT0382595.1 hypothetical protein [Morganella morganii subsp. morganii]MBT0421816.1 hypothetical protein [Morganella morganii subsp. morganii]MBT0516478.1 hypothetical protein [Morganella morganii subsp. morganii]MCU6355644.1 hypothetical protein [Morganella morganii]MRE58111.1 hypothetical protein [Morganella morganii]
MDANLKFQKALFLLDHNQLEKGRFLLEDVVLQAENENNIITLVQASVCLGELLCEIGLPHEAKPILQKILKYKSNDLGLEYEFEKTSELLSTDN